MSRTRGPVFVLAFVGAMVLGTATAYWLEHSRGQESPSDPADDRKGEDPLEWDVAFNDLIDAGSRLGANDLRRAAGEPSASSTLLDPPAHEVPMAALRGRVLDASQRALGGARVFLTRCEAREFDVLDPNIELSPPALDETFSGTDGTFTFRLPRGLPVDVTASLEGYSDAISVDAYAGQEIEVVLEPGVLVFGTVRRERDGAPVEEARVRAFRLGGPSSLEREALTRADGGFQLRIPFSDDAQLEILADGLASSGWIPLEIGPDDRCQMDVALGEGLVVSGRVTASDTGLPIPDATVGEGWWFRRSVVTDARGAYRLSGFGGPGVNEVSVRARGFGGTRRSNLPPPVDGLIQLDFVLRPARAVHGRVVDETERPLANAYVAAVASEVSEEGQRTDWLSTRTDEAGVYRIDDLSTELGHALFVTKAGYGTQVHDFPEEEFERPDLELADIVMHPPALVTGHVEDPNGRALAGVEVGLLGWNHDRYRFTQSPTARGRFYVDQRSVKTDARGRFWFGDLAAGRYQLVTRVSGRPESTPYEVEVVTGERRESVRLRLDPGATIRGHVVDDRGKPLVGVYVSAQAESLSDPSARPAGHVHVKSDEAGEFLIEGLPVGEYTLRAYPLETPGRSPGEPWLSTTVEQVATGAQSIRIELHRGANIRGRLLSALGTPLQGYVVGTVSGIGNQEFAQTDATGEFSLTVPGASTWTLEVRGSPQSPDFRRVLLRREEVAAGTHDLELRLPE